MLGKEIEEKNKNLSQELPKLEAIDSKVLVPSQPIIMNDIQLKPTNYRNEEVSKPIMKNEEQQREKNKEENTFKEKTFILVKEKKNSQKSSPLLNNKNQTQKDEHENSFLKPHLLKLQEPTEIKSLSKTSENEIDTPQGKSSKKKILKLERKDETEKDKLVKYNLLNFNLIVVIILIIVRWTI